MGPEWGTGERGARGRVAGLADRDGGRWGQAGRLGRTGCVLFGQEPAVAAQLDLALSLPALGYLDQARAVSQRSLTCARAGGGPKSDNFGP